MELLYPTGLFVYHFNVVAIIKDAVSVVAPAQYVPLPAVDWVYLVPLGGEWVYPVVLLELLEGALKLYDVLAIV